MLGTLRKFLAPPLFEDEGVNFNARNLNVVLLSVFLGIVITILRYIALGKFWQGNAGVVFLVTGVAIGGAYILFQKRYILASSMIAIVVLTLMPFALILMSGNGIHDTAIMILPVVVVITSMLLPWQGLVGYVVFIALAFGVLVRMEVNLNLVTPFSKLTTNSDFTDALTILIVAGLMSGLLVASLRRYLRQLGEDVKRRRIIEASLRQQADQMSALYDIGLSITSNLDLDQTLHDLCEHCRKLLPIDTFYVAIYDEPSNIVSHPLFYEDNQYISVPDRNIQSQPGLSGSVILSQGTLYLPDKTNPEVEQKYKVLKTGGTICRSYVGVPMIFHGKITGVVSMQKFEADAYLPEQIRLLETIATQAAVAIENARLFASESLAFENSETLRESVAIVATTLEKSEAVRQILLQLKRVVPYDSASVQLINGEFLEIVGGEGLPSDTDLHTRFPINIQEPSYPILNGQAPYVLFDNIQDAIPTFDNIPHNQIRTWLSVPLNAKGKIIGIIALDGYHVGQFSERHAQLAVTYANQVAIALENARLYTELQQELIERRHVEETLRQRDEILQAVAHAAQVFLQSSNWRESISQTLAGLGNATDASHVYIFENHVIGGNRYTSQRYEWVSSKATPEINNPNYQNVPLFGEGQKHWSGMLGAGQTVGGNMDTLPKDEAEYFFERGIKSILDVPIFVRGEWWGVIGFDDYFNERIWSPVEIEALEIAAKMISAAIAREQIDEAFRQNEEKHRSDLEEQVLERTSQLTLANQLLQTEKVKIEQAVDEVATLRRLSDFLQSSMTVEEASSIVASHMNSLFMNTSGGLYLITDGFIDLTLMSSWGEFKTETVIQPNDCWGMRRGRSFVRHASDASPACAHFGGVNPHGSLCLPLMGQNEIIGMLCLQASKNEKTYFTSDIQNLAIACADSVALALANLRLRERLHNQSVRDPLTGLFNRRYLEETLARETHRASRSQNPLCVIMFEVDDFKIYNNTFGHEAGDYVLRKVADTMRVNLRRSDFPCRYGGDEFTLLLPETTLQDGAHRAEELRKSIEVLALSYNNQALGQVTVRMGVAAYPKHGETGEAVLKVADDASYRARAIGKNCVVVAE
jgi:diguanylate cyclase (GGDEF)-like protein